MTSVPAPAFSSRHGRELSQTLVDWYEAERRDLPWRRTRDAYAIWVSEVMLQQTRVEVVIGRWERFLRRFPSLRSLARADPQEVLAEWAGLGYYRRARLLHEAARRVEDEHDGQLPKDYATLLELPGLGAYTAAAVASIAYDEAAPAVDGNVERVLSRLLALRGDPKRGDTARAIRGTARALVREGPPRLVSQGLMELGALVCLPRQPRCELCPWSKACRARRSGRVEDFPKRPAAREPKLVSAYAAVLRKGERALWRRRPAGGHNEGLWELPTTAWHEGEADEKEARERLEELGRELQGEWRVKQLLATVKHSITHHRVTVCAFAVEGEAEGGHDTLRWASLKKAQSFGLTAAAAKLSRQLAQEQPQKAAN